MAEKKSSDDKPKAAAPKVRTAKSTDSLRRPAAAAAAKEVPVTTEVKSSPIGGPVSDRAPKRHRAVMTTKRLVGLIIGAVVVVVVAVLVIFGVMIYGYRSESSAVRAVTTVVPYPVMKVGNDFVSYHEYLFEMDSIRHYYQSQASANGQKAVDFSTTAGKAQLEQLRKQILTELKSDEVTRQLIATNHIVVTDKQVNAQYQQLVTSAGGEAKLKDVLTKVYGWNVNDLKTKLKFQLETQALSNKITSDPTLQAQAKAKAQNILNQIKAGGDFATLAKKYSQDSSAANGGDIGFISHGQTGDTALETTAFSQSPGQVSNVIKNSQYGYEIVKTIEFNADKSQVHVAEILIKPIDFQDYLNQKVAATKSTTYIKS